ncbi:hypothetical protein [Rhizobium sp. CAU 1783]
MMDQDPEIAIALLGAPRGDKGWSLERCAARAEATVLELKSAEAGSPVDRLTGLLDDLTQEMRDQFELFRRLRTSAEGMIDGADEAAAKAARADVKAATDAIALIVRTLEKIDSLKRQLARDREDAALASGEGEDEEEIRQELLRIIEVRAEARAEARLEARLEASLEARMAEGRAREGGERGAGDAGGIAGAGPPEPGATPGTGGG